MASRLGVCSDTHTQTLTLNLMFFPPGRGRESGHSLCLHVFRGCEGFNSATAVFSFIRTLLPSVYSAQQLPGPRDYHLNRHVPVVFVAMAVSGAEFRLSTSCEWRLCSGRLCLRSRTETGFKIIMTKTRRSRRSLQNVYSS
ncbi:unnamed protein product [Protopolystoma xenopodis]|uniref:Uncharacterized protein n=1 Tax=Protopolystoma xenopodis TaxID=117903 RepID=A0A3S5B673_9PLAT|nr:unnamed protein product [Protopolystoma xenopodis]